MVINVLKHNYPSTFSDSSLLGLQFQLECLSADGSVDYQEFIKLFIEDTKKGRNTAEIRIDKKPTYSEEEYTDILSSINSHAKSQGLDLKRIFDIFTKQGFISFLDVSKILELIEFPIKSHQLEVLQRFADGEDGNIERDSVLAENLLN